MCAHKDGPSSGFHRPIAPITQGELRHIKEFVRNETEPLPHLFYGEAAQFSHLYVLPLCVEYAVRLQMKIMFCFSLNSTDGPILDDKQ